MTRYRLMLIVAVCVLLLLTPFAFAGGAQETSDEAAQEGTTGAVPAGTPSEFGEAPMLTALVDRGELPPVEERLPADPMVVTGLEEIGEYGGQANVAYWARGLWFFEVQAMFAPFEFPFGLDREVQLGVANVLRDYEFSQDMRVLTMYLREGMKWSDGDDFNADDWMFWYEDVLLNEELTPTVNAKLKPGGEVMKMSALDDYTLRIEFAVAYPTAVLVLTHPWGMGNIPGYLPSHFLKEFHPAYNTKAAELAKSNGHDEWYQYFWERNTSIRDLPGIPERPTVNAYRLSERGTDHYLFERNPYYWKVDPAGNQLPYIDRVFTRFVSNVEISVGMITNGEIDAAFLGQSIENFPLFKENEDQGHYVTETHPVSFTAPAIRINQTTEDDAVRALLEDKRFRIALSLAIDRQEMNELLFFGLGRPGQWTVSPASEYFEPEFAEAYSRYDLDRANALLDDIGLTWDSNHEYRLRPDGEELGFEMLFSSDHGGAQGTAELLKEHWRDIGVNLDARSAARELMTQRAQSNTVEIMMWGADGGVMFTTLPHAVVPTSNAPWFAGSPHWALWFTSEGADGIEPPEEAKMVYNNWQKMLLAPDAERIRLGKELLRSQAENLYTIGTVSDLPLLLFVARDNMGNLPDETLVLDQAAGYFGPK